MQLELPLDFLFQSCYARGVGVEQSLKEERTNRIAQHLLDRLIQDLTNELLPLLKSNCRLKVEITSGSERTVDKPLSISVTKHIN